MTSPVRPFGASTLLLALLAGGASPVDSRALPTPAAPAVLSPVAARIRADVAWLVSPDLKGRRDGSAEGARVAEGIAERFRKLALLPAGPKGSYLQPFDVLDGVDFPADATPRRVRSVNVLGLLPGADPRANTGIVIVAASYDRSGPGGSAPPGPGGAASIPAGAGDSAAGTATLLEIARHFSERKPPLPRSLLFVALGAGETGAPGLLHVSKNPTVVRESVVAWLNVGTIGRLRGDRLDVEEIARLVELLEPVVAAVASAPERISPPR